MLNLIILLVILSKNINFHEVYIESTIETCEKRDPKGLYAKARSGKLKNFTGIDSAYESPEIADLKLNTLTTKPEICVDMIIEKIPRK